MKRYYITEEILQAILQYLENRPHKEVAQAIVVLNHLPEVKENADTQ